jgi:hypothetical protein
MISVLAHQGGWDELLIAAALVAGVLGVSRLRRRGRTAERSAPPEPDPAACAYCGAHLEAGDERCSSCGFRARRTA